MSGDDDELLDQVMHGLKGVLGDLDASGLRGAVKEGLREALAAFDHDEGPAERELTPEGRPKVVVIDGGLSESSTNEPDTEVTSTVSVQLMRSTAEGWLAPSGDWQTIYAGDVPAHYRVAVTHGAVEVAIDDRTVAELHDGQSCDLRGSTIRCRGNGSGSYRLL